MEINPKLCEYRNRKKQGLQRLSLLIDEYSGYVKCFFIKP